MRLCIPMIFAVLLASCTQGASLSDDTLRLDSDTLREVAAAQSYTVTLPSGWTRYVDTTPPASVENFLDDSTVDAFTIEQRLLTSYPFVEEVDCTDLAVDDCITKINRFGAFAQLSLDYVRGIQPLADETDEQVGGRNMVRGIIADENRCNQCFAQDWLLVEVSPHVVLHIETFAYDPNDALDASGEEELAALVQSMIDSIRWEDGVDEAM